MNPKVFVDLDGVLADFDSYYHQLWGIWPDKNAPAPPGFWGRIAKHKEFFLELPLMPGAMDLWNGVKALVSDPIILTGGQTKGSTLIQKRQWVDEHLGRETLFICCRSRQKSKFAHPGDILIDDWLKYRDLWTGVGGTFIHHVDPYFSLGQLEAALASQP